MENITLGMGIYFAYHIFAVLVLIGGKSSAWDILLAPITFPLVLGQTLLILLRK